jgi:hypothetical protein
VVGIDGRPELVVFTTREDFVKSLHDQISAILHARYAEGFEGLAALRTALFRLERLQARIELQMEMESGAPRADGAAAVWAELQESEYYVVRGLASEAISHVQGLIAEREAELDSQLRAVGVRSQLLAEETAVLSLRTQQTAQSVLRLGWIAIAIGSLIAVLAGIHAWFAALSYYWPA